MNYFLWVEKDGMISLFDIVCTCTHTHLYIQHDDKVGNVHISVMPTGN
jgi:hypothetical protein